MEAGKKADFIILDRDLFSVDENDIGATVVVETFVDGECVYKDDSQGSTEKAGAAAN